MQFDNHEIGVHLRSKGRLCTEESEYLQQHAMSFAERICSGNLITVGFDIYMSNSSLYLNFWGERGRCLSLRLSNHEPVFKSSKSRAESRLDNSRSRPEKSTSVLHPNLSENEIDLVLSNGQDFATFNVTESTEAPKKNPKTVATGHKTHHFSRKRKGSRILWSWPYESFATWNDFERIATKIVRNWMASECLGGKMSTYNKERF